MEVLKPLMQALLPCAQKQPPALAGVPSLSAPSELTWLLRLASEGVAEYAPERAEWPAKVTP